MTRDLDWFPELPAGWHCKPLKAICDYRVSNVDKVPADGELPVRLCNYTDVYHNEFIRLDMDLMQTTATQAEIDRFGLAVDDVVITKDSETWDDIGVPAMIAESAPDLVCGYHLAMIRPNASAVDGRYLFRCLQARPMQFQFERTATGVTRFGLGVDAIGRLYLPVPPLAHQRAIAAFLDRETAKIDAMIAAKQRLLDLLAEKRRALITHAVTRGLKADVHMKDSGVEWIGQLPCHWSVIPLKYGFEHVGSGTTPSTSSPEYYGGDTPWVTTSELRENIVRSTAKHVTRDALRDHTSLRLYPPGSLLFAMYGATIGRVALLGVEATVNQAVCVFSRPTRLDPTFASISLQACREYLIELATGGGQPNLNGEKIANHKVACPPLDEQQKIVNILGQRLCDLDSITDRLQRTVTLGRERRAALIAAAVTGVLEMEDDA